MAGKLDVVEFQREVRALRTTVSSTKSSKAGAPRSTGGQRSKKLISTGDRQYPTTLPNDVTAVSGSDLDVLLPPSHCRLHRDNNEHRWKLSYFGRTKSLSWKLHGFDASLRSLLKLAWTTWELEGWGAPCPFKHLFEDQGAPGTGAQSSSSGGAQAT